MGAPTGWTAPKTDWDTDDAPTATLFNNIEGNTYAAELGARTINQAVAPADNATTLQVYIDEIAHQLNAIIGKDNWYDTPDKTLKQASERFVVSGAAFDNDDVGYDEYGFLDTNLICIVQKFATYIPAESTLVVRRARYHIDTKVYRLCVMRDPATIPGYPDINLFNHYNWHGADNSAMDHSENDETPTEDNVIAWNGTGSPVLKTIFIGIHCVGGSLGNPSTIKAGDGWTIEFDFEESLPTTTTTAGA